MRMDQDERDEINKRAAELADLQPQQLLAYVAALMEKQVVLSRWMEIHLRYGIEVHGNVKVENDDEPLAVKIEEGIFDSPLKVEVANEVKLENDDLNPLHVEITNSPLDVEVRNTPLEVTKY